MVMNEAVPRLSAGLFSGIMGGVLESAAIECLSINVEPITIERLSSERLYSRGGKEAGYFYSLPVCGKRGDVPRVGRFQASLISRPEESRDITDVRRGAREECLSTSGKLPLLEERDLFPNHESEEVIEPFSISLFLWIQWQ